jgi:hypothetical protein
LLDFNLDEKSFNMSVENNFQKTGSAKIHSPIGLIFITLISLCLGLLFGLNILYSIAIPVLLVSLYLVRKIISNPKIAFIIVFILSFFAVGLTRIVPAPLGLAIDGLLVLAYIILFFKSFNGANWHLKNNTLTYCMLIWMIYCFLEIFNPEAQSFLAWFYAVRGLGMLPFLLCPIIFLIVNKQKDFQLLIYLWFGISALLGLYGAKQYWLGLFHFEQVWLDTEGYVTHVLWGKFTRMFSFCSDANQFGQSMAHVALVSIIMSLGTKNYKRKILYVITGACTLLGMVLSGTRGAIITPVVGFGIYFLLSKNFTVLLVGSIVGSTIMYILVFTYIGHGVEPIRRMRTAFDSEDKSFLVRVENRANLENYLQDKPFGGGIGSAGVWGNRFTPNNFLADFQTDGHYVRIYAETGIVGLYLFYILHIIIIGKMALITLKLKNKQIQNTMNALTSGAVAVMVANYSAAVTVALPTSIILYWSMAIVYISPVWDKGNELPDFLAKKDVEESTV